jgi:hypothetical protein
MLGIVMWFALIFIGMYDRGPNWDWYWPWEEWSHRRITKLTLKNLPNLWGGVLLASYFLLGLPILQKIKSFLSAKAGPKAPGRLSAGLHMVLGFLMAAALFVPLLFAPDPDYPLHSEYTRVLEALGRSGNAPAAQGMYQMVQHFGPMIGYSVLAGLVAVAGLSLGWLGMAFGRFKDRLYAELGEVKYAIVMGLFLLMMGVLAKIMLRLLFGLKYLISLPSFGFNL